MFKNVQNDEPNFLKMLDINLFKLEKQKHKKGWGIAEWVGGWQIFFHLEPGNR
jgi:hypothetical protein